LTGEPFAVDPKGEAVRWWMEFLQPSTAAVVARYDHPVWGRYAAITRNRYGKGEVTYLGFMPSDTVLEKILGEAAGRAHVVHLGAKFRFPLIVRSGVSGRRKMLHYLFNYSAEPQKLNYPFATGTELLSGSTRLQGAPVTLPPWRVEIVEQAIP
jgi:beta-galactosidase